MRIPSKWSTFKKVLPKLLRLIRENKKFLIVSHINPEGDAVGSSIALALGLKKIGKTAYILNKDTIPEILNFLPSLKLFNQPRKIRTQEFDVLFLIDCNTIERTGFKTFHVKNIVVIDHHIPQNKMQDTRCKIQDARYKANTSHSMHPNISWIDPDASATGDLIYKLLTALRVPIDKEIATNLYTAIFTDTGGFRYSNTSPESLNIASQLIKAGAEPWEVTKEVYENISFNCLRLLTLCLATLEKQGKIAWVTITHDMYKKTNTSVQDTENFANYPRMVKGIEVAILFRQEKKDLYKISFRSKGTVNVADIAALFGGGGHSNAAGCTEKGSLEKVKEKVLKAVRAAITIKKHDARCMIHDT